MKALILQHIECEPAAVYEDELIARGASVTMVEVDTERTVPDWHDFDLILSMGGPMSVYEAPDLPWIETETALIRAAVGAQVPVWGVCLGAQILASALGARVYAGGRPEVGIMAVDLTPSAHLDPVFSSSPTPLTTLQWHGDTFDLPQGAVLLASSPTYPNQAFRYGSAYGLQFHLEVSPHMARRWAEVPAYEAALDRTHGPGSLPGLISDLELVGPQMNAVAGRLFGAWLDLAGLRNRAFSVAIGEPARS
ncbi:MAG TPA: type 1 glutamine amidotransferase [Candidatus Dormibacteraeota bacterium]|nr:type 1 glutamine amidotransferase [Candidatus Dormibacteraeota bacterium]